MSSSIWTREELLASSLVIETTVWRMVEAQHRVSTMKLVDSLGEQAALERVLESTKPEVPADGAHLHYLLYSPFRYARGNPYASRFRRAGAPEGVFYASAAPETALAEIVFYRLLFFAESPATSLPGNPSEFSAFAVQMRADPGLDLMRAPMSAHLRVWTDPGDYSSCHALADEARAGEVQAICYPSVRDRQHRVNYAVLTPKAFAQPAPIAHQSWHILVRADSVLAKCEAPDIGITFQRRDFDVDSRLAISRKDRKH